MTLTLFLQITVPVAILGLTLIITLFANNNKSHKNIWEQINENSINITNRLTRIETILDHINNGKKNNEKK